LNWTKNSHVSRVARWYIFEPKEQIWVFFGGSCNGRCWYILWTFGLFYGHLVYLMYIGYFCGYLEYFSPFWYVLKKIWQPCDVSEAQLEQSKHFLHLHFKLIFSAFILFWNLLAVTDYEGLFWTLEYISHLPICGRC
jgi:hypothetical protein